MKNMEIRELISYYEEEIYHLLEDQRRFSYDNLEINQTIMIYRKFITELKQLLF